MTMYRRIRRLLDHPAPEIARKMAAFARRKIVEAKSALRDRVITTYPSDADLPAGELKRLLPSIDPERLVPWRSVLQYVAGETLRHRFNLLGSGPIVVYPGMQCPGLEGRRYSPMAPRAINKANSSFASKLRRLITQDYRPIDWHIDFRSGYRWPEDTPYTKISYGDLPGADVKIPWELARMQHAGWLALAYSQSASKVDKDSFVLEFQNQTLDFMAANPPRFGVNWACTMDVAIRIANLLMAYDLFRSFGADFDAPFQQEFKRTVFAHGRHIVDNLEWFPNLRSNHYLSNIAGLLFVAAYLPRTAETDAWLALASNELGKEIPLQFQRDGSNFEASTSYHRLSAEMVLFSIAIAHAERPRLEAVDVKRDLRYLRHRGPGALPANLGTPSDIQLTSSSMAERLAGMGRFTRAITRPDGEVVQIGDNDSGRFFRLTPDFSALAQGIWIERTNAHSAFVSGIDTACKGISSAAPLIDAIVIDGLIGNALLEPDAKYYFELIDPDAQTELVSFPDFGLYIYRQQCLWMAVRCGNVGQNGNGGHAHNDQLALEICLDGRPFVVDQGTYLYTPCHSSRNAFRSTASHATLRAYPGEQNSWLAGKEGLFSISRVATCKVMEVGPSLFVGQHLGFSQPHTRSVNVCNGFIQVTDSCEAPGRTLILPLAPGVNVVKGASNGCLVLENAGVAAIFRINSGSIDVVERFYSPGYGQRIATKSILIKDVAPKCEWHFGLRDISSG